LEIEQENRINELKEILPLQNEASNCLQAAMKNQEQSNGEVIKRIIEHVDKKIDELSKKCSNND
jgi:hypothetical protein